jgi:hypothetical protein
MTDYFNLKILHRRCEIVPVSTKGITCSIFRILIKGDDVETCFLVVELDPRTY